MYGEQPRSTETCSTYPTSISSVTPSSLLCAGCKADARTSAQTRFEERGGLRRRVDRPRRAPSQPRGAGRGPVCPAHGRSREAARLPCCRRKPGASGRPLRRWAHRSRDGARDWRNPGKLRPSFDVEVFPRMSAKQGAQRGQSEARPPLLSRNCGASATLAAGTRSRPRGETRWWRWLSAKDLTSGRFKDMQSCRRTSLLATGGRRCCCRRI